MHKSSSIFVQLVFFWFTLTLSHILGFTFWDFALTSSAGWNLYQPLLVCCHQPPQEAQEGLDTNNYWKVNSTSTEAFLSRESRGKPPPAWQRGGEDDVPIKLQSLPVCGTIYHLVGFKNEGGTIIDCLNFSFFWHNKTFFWFKITLL